MNEVNRTLFIPLYGKAQVSRKQIILRDPWAEEIWEKESFPIRGKAGSRWLAYYMAMRAKVFDIWAGVMIRRHRDAVVLHIGCGLDSRCLRVERPRAGWIDGDLPDVIAQRRKYFQEEENYRMVVLDAARPGDLAQLPDGPAAVVLLEGVSMYLTNQELEAFLRALRDKYPRVYLLMDVYTEFAARVSRYKNPVNQVGVTTLYGVDAMEKLAAAAGLRVKGECSMTPGHLVDQLPAAERAFFGAVMAGGLARKLYRLYALESRRG